MKSITDRLLSLREERSRRSFAKMLGVVEGTLRGYEAGTTTPNVQTLEKICEKLRISRRWLLLGEGPMSQSEADSQEQKATHPPPADEPPRARADEGKLITIPQERLWQMVERDREQQEKIGDLRAEVARLEGRIAAQEQTLQYMREQLLRDARDSYELQEADVGSEVAAAPNAPLKGSPPPRKPSSSE